ncbi:CGNR zinc finger domain-containing protein [Sciscionella sediminilitoris]|uniref:CGNR zinc finger domain-containing protein n=1 Tax=Sciscionella sediminilitoris TaxID=1445613 RepID=UPI0004DF5809|nr:CGNR zinc finger domain-containing protein [Sciscionella sp. SE31]
MRFGPDIECGLGAAVDLVNAGAEGLPDLDTLAEFAADHHLGAHGPLGDRDLRQVHALRSRLAAILGAGDPDTVAELINGVLAGAHTTPRLRRHDGFDWHIDHFAPGATLAEHLGVTTAMALATLFADGEFDRIRSCAAPGCERLLVDLSRNRSRRYCAGRNCGNRLHVAAYRERNRVS